VSALTAALRTDKLVFRAERTEWVEIEVDVAGLVEEWKDDDTTRWHVLGRRCTKCSTRSGSHT
jgi:hypothetical protein